MSDDFNLELLGSKGLLGIDEELCKQNFAETCRSISGSKIQLKTIDCTGEQHHPRLLRMVTADYSARSRRMHPAVLRQRVER